MVIVFSDRRWADNGSNADGFWTRGLSTGDWERETLCEWRRGVVSILPPGIILSVLETGQVLNYWHKTGGGGEKNCFNVYKILKLMPVILTTGFVTPFFQTGSECKDFFCGMQRRCLVKTKSIAGWV